MSTTISSSQTAATSSTQPQRLTAAISAALLGACLVYFAGSRTLPLCTMRHTIPVTALPFLAIERH